MSGGKRRVVAVWRNLWLPPSETFVRDHVRGLNRWTAVPVGLHSREAGLGLTPRRAPFPHNDVGRRLARLSLRLGHPVGYDRVLRESGASLVHAHFGTGAVHALPIAARLGLPLVVTFHGHDVNRAPVEDRTGDYRRRLARVFDYASLLLPVSDFLAERLVELGAPAEKVRVHHLGVPVPTRLADPAGPRSAIVFVGRLTAQKGVADLIRAHRALPGAVRETPLLIAGDGPERPALSRLAAQAPTSPVTFLGRVSPGRVAELMSRARVVVAPSKRCADGDAEAFGLVTLEASLGAAPVVGYDFAGLREAIAPGVSGILVPEGDVASLSTAIARLLSDPAEAIELGRGGQRRVVDDFDAAHRNALLEDLYDQVVQAGVPIRTSTSGVRP